MHALTVSAFHLFGFSLLFGILYGISDNVALKRIFIVLFCLLVLNLVLLIVFVPKKQQSLSDKTLSEVAMENNQNHPIIQANPSNIDNNWDVWIDSTKFTNISLDSFKRVIINYQKQ